MSRTVGRISDLVRISLGSKPNVLFPLAQALRVSRNVHSFRRPLTLTSVLERRLTSRSKLPIHPRSQSKAHSFSDSSSSSSSQQIPPLPENASLSQRLKFLIKRYGWYALGVYTFFTIVDFGLTFAAINYLGAEYVGKLTDKLKAYLPPIPWINPADPPESEAGAEPNAREPSKRDSLYTMLVLAYGIHKTLLLPVRVGLTAGLTPKFVEWLAARGWIGREGAKKAALEMRQKMRRTPGSKSNAAPSANPNRSNDRFQS